MTFCDLPDVLDLGEGDFDADIKEQVLKAQENRDEIKHPNPGKTSDLKRATGPKIVHVPVYREPTAQMRRPWEEVNAASRDLCFSFLNAYGRTRPHLKRWRDNMEKSQSLKDILGQRLSFANHNDLTQAGTLLLNSYIKALSDDVPLHESDPTRKRQRNVAFSRETGLPHAQGAKVARTGAFGVGGDSRRQVPILHGRLSP